MADEPMGDTEVRWETEQPSETLPEAQLGAHKVDAGSHPAESVPDSVGIFEEPVSRAQAACVFSEAVAPESKAAGMEGQRMEELAQYPDSTAISLPIPSGNLELFPDDDAGS